MTTIAIDGEDFRINGKLTYPGRRFDGHRVEGLLMNSRMVQAIFDDECPETRCAWVYPDTSTWDPERNVREFCAALPEYYRHGLLGITVGLQGGGAIYTSPIYEHYVNTAFRPDGSLKPSYLDRLLRVIQAADAIGMVVIVNYFYWRQERFDNDAAVVRATETITQWLLATGYRNLLVDVKNEIMEGDGLTKSRGVGRLVDIAKAQTLGGRRLLVGTSTHPFNNLAGGDWTEKVDFLMPHGNDAFPDQWRKELRHIRETEYFRRNPRPICCTDDSVDVRNLNVCLEEHCSWGYYDQGYGCAQKQAKHDWTMHPREKDLASLSGFQTIPVNWSINTDHKRAFFGRVKQITG
jgi:hypothetical protein